RYYIAYGSNLNVQQMRMRCPSARIIGTSVLEDHKLLFKGSKTGSYLTVEKKPGSSVPVGVWEVTPADEKTLDRYEGFPNFYYKKELTLPVKGIRTGKIRKRRVFVYIMYENRPIGIPSISYMQTCIQGYDDFGFDWAGLLDAYLKCGEER
ncbi:MAG: gamma-glutamylcyclotransferase family protein, partial [Oscillospiraceae bacterium]|nr:gamma-glutamylcyclotransferase family protein [Oscillospiraceae bacterium]